MPVTIKYGDILSEFGGDNQLIAFNAHSEVNTLGELVIASPVMAGLKRLAPNLSSVFIKAFQDLDKQGLSGGKKPESKSSVCYGLIPYDTDNNGLKQRIALMHTRVKWNDVARTDFLCHSLSKLQTAVMYYIAYGVPAKRILVEDVISDDMNQETTDAIKKLYNMCSSHIEIWRPGEQP